MDALYRRVNGVTKVVSGYSGGTTEHPTMADVYGGKTGHAEVVQVTFDPAIITYRDILGIFFVMHDPTTHNRQGNDVGDEYRSVIFYHTDEQRAVAEDMTQHFAADLWPDPVVTQIVPLDMFWPADDTNQDYFNKNPEAGYCQIIINPKITKLRQKFAARFKES